MAAGECWGMGNEKANLLIDLREILTRISGELPERRPRIISDQVRQLDYAAAGKAYSQQE